MKKIILPIILSAISLLTSGQNVGINSTGSAPNTSAILDVDASNKGLLIPRVSLLTTTDIATIASPATSLLVYNTNATITGVGANGVGFYYYDGSKWIKLLPYNNTSTAWLTTGNSGTIDGTNFIGTIDNIPLNFRINNNKAGRIDSANANVFLGSLSGGNLTEKYNTAIGHFALKNNTDWYNTAVGAFSLANNLNGDNNTAIGSYALFNNLDGGDNSAIGNFALYSNTYGRQNTAIGRIALYKNTTGNFNTATGYIALYNNLIGEFNTANGSGALQNNTSGNYNTAIGSNALARDTSGSENVANGSNSLFNNLSGLGNTSIGFNSLYSNSSGNYNTANGSYSLYDNTIGNYNTANGAASLRRNTTGIYNTANGAYALVNNSVGNYNTATGSYSLYNNFFGNNNTAIGVSALRNNSSGNSNIAIGDSSLFNNNNGNNNIGIGKKVLFSNVSGNNNTGIGYSAEVINGLTNATAIGANAKVDLSNSLVLGSINGTNGATANTNVGIGTTAPNAPLQFGNYLVNRKIVLFDGNNNDHQFYGFGVTVEGLRYQIGYNSYSHIFYAGSSPTTSTELMRIQGNGNVGIGTPTPNAPLQFGNYIVNRKIVLFDGNNNDHQFYGFGINTNALRYQTDGSSSDHIFYSAINSTSSKELMRIKGNGNVGISESNPTTAKLVISGTASQEGLDLSSADQYANLRVIRNSLNGSDKDMYIGFQSGATSSLHLYSNNTETITVKGNNVGIGVSASPAAKLQVAGAFVADGAQITHTQGAWLEWNKDNGGGKTYLLNQKGLGAGGLVIGEVDGANVITERIIIDNAGNVGIGTTLPLLQKFTVIGSGTFSGTVNASCGVLVCSDIRYKKNILPLQNMLSKVMQLNGVSYYFKKEEFKDKNFNNNKQVGLIAQEVEKIYPELVQTDLEGFKSIDYAKLTPILIEAIKELKQQNDTLKEDNLQLKTSIQKLDTKIESIEKLLQTVLPISQSSK